MRHELAFYEFGVYACLQESVMEIKVRIAKCVISTLQNEGFGEFLEGFERGGDRVEEVHFGFVFEVLTWVNLADKVEQVGTKHGISG